MVPRSPEKLSFPRCIMDVVGSGGQANLSPSIWQYGENSTSRLSVRHALSIAQTSASRVMGKSDDVSR